MLTQSNVVDLVRYPLVPMGRTHLRRVRFRLSKTVASNGRLFFTFTAGHLPYFSADSTSSNMLLLANANYDCNITSNNITAAAGSWDTTVTGFSGMNLTNTHFEQAMLVGCHVSVGVTGVSSYERKGRVYIAEDITGHLAFGNTSTTDAVVANQVLNRYPLANLVKLLHSKSVDIANMSSDTNIEYHYVPLTSYARPKIYTPSQATSSGYYASYDGPDLS